MHSSRLTTQRKLQISEDNGLDPLSINELLLQIVLPVPLKLSAKEPPLIQLFVFKLMYSQHENQMIIYVMSETDLFFLYKIEVNSETIQTLNDNFQLTLKNLFEFADLLADSFHAIENQSKIATLAMTAEQELQLTIFNSYAGKSFVLLQICGQPQLQEMIKALAAYRYGSLRESLTRKEEKISNLRELVRLKNPYLLKHFTSNETCKMIKKA